MIEIINQYLKSLKERRIELYSEFGLQHEMALYLRANLE